MPDAEFTSHSRDLVHTPVTVGESGAGPDGGVSVAAVGAAVGTVVGVSSLFAAPPTPPVAAGTAVDADPGAPVLERPMTPTYLRFFMLLAGAVGGALLVRAYPDLVWNQLDWVRAQPQWMFALFTGLLGLVMFRLGIDLSRDWPVAFGSALAAGSLAAGMALVGSSRFIIAGYPDSPYVIPVGLLLVMLAIGAVRLRPESGRG